LDSGKETTRGAGLCRDHVRNGSMKPTDETTIQRATIDNADEIVKLQEIAYVSEAEILDDFTIQPLCQTINEILSEFNK